MLIGGIVAVYVAGALTTAYICGRIGEDFLVFFPILFWPIFALFAPFWILTELGKRHGGHL